MSKVYDLDFKLQVVKMHDNQKEGYSAITKKREYNPLWFKDGLANIIPQELKDYNAKLAKTLLNNNENMLMEK